MLIRNILFSPVNISNSPKLTKVAMFLLAAYPILGVYIFMGTPFNYASLSSLLITIVLLFKKGGVIFRELPVAYYVFWLYAALQMLFIAGIQGWSDFFPGGVTLCLFSLSIASYAFLFDMNCLYKYMRAIWLFAAALFLIQYVTYYATGIKLSVFLPLSQNLTYGGLTYDELLAKQITLRDSESVYRFCSIFCEPSYFGQYSTLFLALELFRNEAKDKLCTPLSVIVALIIVLIQSGVGLLGLGLVAIVKLIHIVLVSRKTKYYLFLALSIPVFLFILSRYISSEMGSYVLDRASELQKDETSTTSGSMRIYYGWIQYGMLSPYEQALGTSRNFISAFFEDGGFISGACAVFIGLGWIGAILLSLFYLRLLKRNVLSVSFLLIYIMLMLVESIYLGGLMLICTSILLGLRKVQVKY